MKIIAETVGNLYEQLLGQILFRGIELAPRGNMTKEIINVNLVLEDFTQNIILNETRDLNYRFMVAEWIWIALGREDVYSISKYNSQMMQYSDDHIILQGAYGPRIRQQIDYVIDTLKNDPLSRQAVLTIWTWNPPRTKDVPCTISFQFFIRGNHLHLIVNMRSSDAWLGIPYDIFTFTQIANQMAAALKVRPGKFMLNLGSSHLYSEHWEKARHITLHKTETIKSPILNSPIIPDMLEHQFTGMAVDKDTLLEEPWLRYGLVLASKNRHQALQCLEAV